jgi:hypothetical protein
MIEILVLYYSAGGSVRRMAELIAGCAGAPAHGSQGFSGF